MPLVEVASSLPFAKIPLLPKPEKVSTTSPDFVPGDSPPFLRSPFPILPS
ncbi:MAG: hypothetical protein HC890_11575 [Chloroflexaceae bacterium]|nr:hypothetical protein [Chloroflexaceae bacterium]